MAKPKKETNIPNGHVQLKGSELHPSASSKLLGPADTNEVFSVTIMVRRRPDGPALPDFDYFSKTPMSQRQRLSDEEFAAKYGALPEDFDQVAKFVNSYDLKVTGKNASRRAVIVSGTVAQMSKAFGVTLARYEYKAQHSRKKTKTQIYRGYDGLVHIPQQLSGIVTGVFGLENRNICHRNGDGQDPDVGAGPITVSNVINTLYQFPQVKSALPNIAVFAPGNCGFFPSDINASIDFDNNNSGNPNALPHFTPTTISINSVNPGTNGNPCVQTYNNGTVTNSTIITISLSDNQYNTLIPYVNVNSNWVNLMSSGLSENSVQVNDITQSSATQATLTLSQAVSLTDGQLIYLYPYNESFNQETTMDICISYLASRGADIFVYFTTLDQNGCASALSRMIHPEGQDPVCQVISSSWAFLLSDDISNPVNQEVANLGFVEAVNGLLIDAAIHGITVCFASGDGGSSDSKYPGSADPAPHVQFPASSPWVLGVGGTSIGYLPSKDWLEFPWNDYGGATGGGVSEFFPVPSYQQGIVTQASLAPMPGLSVILRRGVPDVAANASPNSAYTIFRCGNPYVDGTGTSAAAPLWAGLIALLNSNLDFNVGFINPILYQLGANYQASPDTAINVFNPANGLYPQFNLNTANCPTDNSWGTSTNSLGDLVPVPGYQTHGYTNADNQICEGWDACTGWGSPNGGNLLQALKAYSSRDCFFMVETDTFDQQAVLAGSPPVVFKGAFYFVVDGYSPVSLGITSASFVSPSVPSNGPVLSASITLNETTFVLAQITVQNEANLMTAQRVMYTYNVEFTGTADFPGSWQAPTAFVLTAAITPAGAAALSASTVLNLNNQPAPYFAGNGQSWLSNDLRVFQFDAINKGANWWVPAPDHPTGIELDNTGNAVPDATGFIESLIAALTNNTYSPQPGVVTSPGGPIPSFFDLLPDDYGSDDQLTGLPTDSSGNPVYNFAVARVRYDASIINAENVRVFFRVITAASTNLVYNQQTTYRRYTADSIAIPLFGIDTVNNDVISIPCFAQARVDSTTASLTSQTDFSNVQSIPATGSEVDVYYGCWLDINQSEPEYPLPPIPSNTDGPFNGVALSSIGTLVGSSHHCLVAEIAYDPSPIAQGTVPAVTGQLAQRNLMIVPAPNPGKIGSRTVPVTFYVRPTPIASTTGLLADELMIDWGNTPAGARATIYWPEVKAADVGMLANIMYGKHSIKIVDNHTVEVPVGSITYIPIPPGAGETYFGLISIILPLGIVKGQLFNIVVRQVTNASTELQTVRSQGLGTEDAIWWRRVIGAFQVSIPISTKELLLGPEERTLSLTKWFLSNITPNNRKYAVLNRYAVQIANRVREMGGDPSQILPAANGNGTSNIAELKFTGKVQSLVYDRFGDFEGFMLETKDSKRKFQVREQEMERLIDRAWVERIVITVTVKSNNEAFPVSIELSEPPKID